MAMAVTFPPFFYESSIIRLCENHTHTFCTYIYSLKHTKPHRIRFCAQKLCEILYGYQMCHEACLHAQTVSPSMCEEIFDTHIARKASH